MELAVTIAACIYLPLLCGTIYRLYETQVSTRRARDTPFRRALRVAHILHIALCLYAVTAAASCIVAYTVFSLYMYLGA